jgi:hypothetical protein
MDGITAAGVMDGAMVDGVTVDGAVVMGLLVGMADLLVAMNLRAATHLVVADTHLVAVTVLAVGMVADMAVAADTLTRIRVAADTIADDLNWASKLTPTIV